jgi:hypothetical protein
MRPCNFISLPLALLLLLAAGCLPGPTDGGVFQICGHPLVCCSGTCGDGNSGFCR